MNTFESIVQHQLEAYNRKELDAFLAFYADDVEIYNFQETTLFIHGKDELAKVYSEVFEQSPNLHASIKNRIIFDNKVIDEEHVTGRKGAGLIQVVVIYEVKSNFNTKGNFYS